MKRILDIVASLCGLIVMSPVLVLIALLVRVASKGPAIFHQERVGVGGRSFTLLKFRSMYVDSGSGPQVTRAGESRVTPLGRILRVTKLDELPQLWNVLKGEMSLVGPRPEVPRFVAHYTKEQLRVLSVRPGITDWASIEFRNEEDLLARTDDVEGFYVASVLPRKLALNLRYVDEQSLLMDVRILLMTAWRVLVPPGDRGVVRWLGVLGLRKVQYVIDLAILAGCFPLAYALRLDGIPAPESLDFKQMVFQLPWVMLLQFAMFQLFGIYAFVWRYVGLREVRSILLATWTAGGLLVAVRLGATDSLHYARVPLSITLMDAMLVFMGSVGVRVLRRVSYERGERRASKLPGGERRVLLVGAGRAGVLVVREIQSRGDTGLQPVGFVDDDPDKAGTVICGVKVLGPSLELPALVRELAVDHVIITIASAPAREMRRLVSMCERIPIKVRIIPGLYEILEGNVSVSRIRDVEIEDLLGREPVELLREPMESLLRGQVVMVTGAGGSIGAGLCRQVCHFGAAELVMVERAETPLFDIHRELRPVYPHVRLVPAIADIGEASRMNYLFNAHRPGVVLHAAAHKHVPMMEYNPEEAIRNNVLGTQVVADLALRHRTGTFVLISTDKAVNPTSVMGASKRLAEIYVQSLSARGKTHFVAVRFGNVLGSTGSVVRIFKEQIAHGGPVTVTHPEMLRYFMTVEEATQLVLQAAAIGEGGEIFVLDMGEPVKVLDLAKDMITLSGLRPFEDVDIVFTGVRPGEKLFEEIGFSDERMSRTRHPKIHVGRIRPYPEERVKAIMARAVMIGSGSSTADLRDFLREAVPECQFMTQGEDVRALPE